MSRVANLHSINETTLYKANLAKLIRRAASAAEMAASALEVHVTKERVCMKDEHVAVSLPCVVRPADIGIWTCWGPSAPRQRPNGSPDPALVRPATGDEPIAEFAMEELHTLDAILALPSRGVTVQLHATKTKTFLRVDAGGGAVITLRPERSPIRWPKMEHAEISVDVALLNNALLGITDDDAPAAPVKIYKALQGDCFVLETGQGWAALAGVRWLA